MGVGRCRPLTTGTAAEIIPNDPKGSSVTTRTLSVHPVAGTRDALLRATTWRDAGDLLRRHGVRAAWSPTLRGFRVRRERVPGVVAIARRHGWAAHQRGPVTPTTRRAS